MQWTQNVKIVAELVWSVFLYFKYLTPDFKILTYYVVSSHPLE